MIRTSPSRHGVILIMVIGLAGLLASLALAFIARVKENQALGEQISSEAQARIMLHAACAFVLESSRMGYDYNDHAALPTTLGHLPTFTSSARWPWAETSGWTSGRIGGGHREAFGWADIRDGSKGPKDQDGNALYADGVRSLGTVGMWPDMDPNPAAANGRPQGGVIICPMWCWTRPPYAIRRTTIYNPILADPTQMGNPEWGYPLLRNPDPLPVIDNGWTGCAVAGTAGVMNVPRAAANWSAFASGDATPIPNSLNRSWFRLHRVGLVTFVATCGSGGTMGFKDWAEVTGGINGKAIPGSPLYPALDQSALFGSMEVFNALRFRETRTWYEIQWSAAVKIPGKASLDSYPADSTGVWWSGSGNKREIFPLVATRGSIAGISANGPVARVGTNQVGTISYIQRLKNEPLGQPQPGMNQPWTW